MLLRNNINIKRQTFFITSSDDYVGLKHGQQSFQHGQASILASTAEKAQHTGLGIANQRGQVPGRTVSTRRWIVLLSSVPHLQLPGHKQRVSTFLCLLVLNSGCSPARQILQVGKRCNMAVRSTPPRSLQLHLSCVVREQNVFWKIYPKFYSHKWFLRISVSPCPQ